MITNKQKIISIILLVICVSMFVFIYLKQTKKPDFEYDQITDMYISHNKTGGEYGMDEVVFLGDQALFTVGFDEQEVKQIKDYILNYFKNSKTIKIDKKSLFSPIKDKNGDVNYEVKIYHTDKDYKTLKIVKKDINNLLLEIH